MDHVSAIRSVSASKNNGQHVHVITIKNMQGCSRTCLAESYCCILLMLTSVHYKADVPSIQYCKQAVKYVVVESPSCVSMNLVLDLRCVNCQLISCGFMLVGIRILFTTSACISITLYM